jgi:tetraprenyl-beta-curcumene synthase
LALLRLLVAYQVMWDFLDSVHERAADQGTANGIQLHAALMDALAPNRMPRDYYRYHPWQDDGGYLRELVEVCQENCSLLPGYQVVAPLIAREARRAEVLALNHELDAEKRAASLRAWATREFPDATEIAWWELTGAASAGVTIFALLALAADGKVPKASLLVRTRNVYSPWTAAAATMLDSYVDTVEDEARGDHSYVAYYPTPQRAVERIGQLIQRSMIASRELPNGEVHAVILASMVALYLTKDTARLPMMRHRTQRIARAGGSLTRSLIPVLRLWRIAYAQRGS